MGEVGGVEEGERRGREVERARDGRRVTGGGRRDARQSWQASVELRCSRTIAKQEDSVVVGSRETTGVHDFVSRCSSV
jgi:hypothetical protein